MDAETIWILVVAVVVFLGFIIWHSDVGSKAQLTFKNADALQAGESLVFGLPDEKLQQLLQQDFIQVAAYFVGLENSLDDEIGKFIRGDKNTPFGSATPQLGSTASVAAGLAVFICEFSVKQALGSLTVINILITLFYGCFNCVIYCNF